jgi:hypothetical protein
MLIVLHGSRDCALKADRSLIDPIVKLKMESPKSKSGSGDRTLKADRYKSYASGSVYLFDADQNVA